MAFANFPSIYRRTLDSGSLKSFYDDVVYWEIAKNSNNFFVTFEDGLFGLSNNRMESISTAEINFPHTTAGIASTASFSRGLNRVTARYDAFLTNDETGSGGTTYPAIQDYNGFIPITELRGTRPFQSNITASDNSSVQRTFTYEQFASTVNTVRVTKTVTCSFFYPFSSHQLSVLRKEPTLIIDLKKESELYNGIGERGFALVSEQTDQRVKNNLEYYLEKAGLMDKTTRTKITRKGE